MGAQIAEVLRVKTGLTRREARDRTLELLRAVHLRDPELVRVQYPHELSGGMLQRVLIAAAIAWRGRGSSSRTEATTALDVTVQAEILDLLADLRERTGLALVVVSTTSPSSPSSATRSSSCATARSSSRARSAPSCTTRGTTTPGC